MGHQWVVSYSDTMQNFMTVSCLALAASAYDYSGPGLATWPSTGGLGVTSQCFGCHGYRIGKREAEPFYGYLGAATLENRNNVHGHELASGYSINQPHPGFSSSFQARIQLHSGFGKREAEPFYGYLGAAATLQNNNNVHGHELGSGYAINQPHPGAAGSYQNVNRLHSGFGKREAEPFYGVALHPTGTSFTARSPQGLSYGLRFAYGKREAEPFYGYLGAAATLQNNNNVHGHELGSGYAISQPHPGAAGSYQNVNRLHSGLTYGLGYAY